MGRNVVIPKVGEVDIVARKNDVICFVEVRSRLNSRYGLPSESVGTAKQKKLRKLAEIYLARKGYEEAARFDIASVLWSPVPTIDYIEEAFY